MNADELYLEYLELQASPPPAPPIDPADALGEASMLGAPPPAPTSVVPAGPDPMALTPSGQKPIDPADALGGTSMLGVPAPAPTPVAPVGPDPIDADPGPLGGSGNTAFDVVTAKDAGQVLKAVTLGIDIGVGRVIANFIKTGADAVGAGDVSKATDLFLEYLKTVGTPDDVPQVIGEMVGQFVVPAVGFITALVKAGVRPLVATLLADSFIGFAGMNPDEANLASFIPEDSEAFGWLREALATDPEDPVFYNRMRNLVEALAMLTLGEGVIRAIPWAVERAARIGKAAEKAAKKGQGGSIPPTNPEPSAQQIEVALGDTRQGAEVVGERLNIVVPESERVAGGEYTPGRPGGGKWSDLTPDELSVRGPGFRGTDDTLESLWQQTLSEVSVAARTAVERTGATWEAFNAASWDKALRLPLRSQIWYELSGEKFLKGLPGLSKTEHIMFLDLIGATSARAKPRENLERGLAILSQRLRGVPVDVDVTIPSTVSGALRRSGSDVSSDLANKTGMFSDTLALTAGIPVRYPISVNDVWVGKAFGISDEAMSGNQALHEVFAKFTNKLREEVNAGDIGSGQYPHQSWGLQSRQWVEMRAADEGIDTSKGATISGSDYAGEWDKIVSKLEAAGIDVPDGIITRDILKDPRFADALRTKTPGFRAAPKATVEFGTLLTPNGKRGAELFRQAREVGDLKTQQEYLKTLTTSMYASGRGKPTIWEKTVRVATGRSDKVTRIYSPTSSDPFAISGTFEGAAAPNIRIPLKDMTPDQIAYFNAMVGQGLKQKAMAAAQIRRLEAGGKLLAGEVETSTIRFDWDGVVPEEMITGISNALGEGFEVSAMRFPDGMVVDVNPRFGASGPEGPSADAVDAAIDFLVQSYDVRNVGEFPSAFKSEFGKNYVEDAGDGKEYARIISEALKGWKDGAATEISKLTGDTVSRRDINRFLSGKLGKLPVTGEQLEKAGVTISSVRGRADTVRKTLRQRLSDHDEQRWAWKTLGKDVDSKMGKNIPVWEKRLNGLKGQQQAPMEAP